jgi:hypothetical protein
MPHRLSADPAGPALPWRKQAAGRDLKSASRVSGETSMACGRA